MPVMPEDETLNHIATQVIAEDLASLDNPTLDGMIYRSVEAAKDMKNVVLFHRAAVVAMVLYILLGYWIEMFLWRRRMAKKQGTAAKQ